MLPADSSARPAAAAAALFGGAGARALQALPGRLAFSPEAAAEALGLGLIRVSAADFGSADAAAEAIRHAAARSGEGTLLLISEADLFDAPAQRSAAGEAVRKALRRGRGRTLLCTLAPAAQFAAAGALPVSRSEALRLTSFAAEELHALFARPIEEAALRRGLSAVLAADAIRSAAAVHGRIDAALLQAWLSGRAPSFLRVLGHPVLAARLRSLRRPGRLALGESLRPAAESERLAAETLVAAGLLAAEGISDIRSRSESYFIPCDGARRLFAQALCNALAQGRDWEGPIECAAEALYKADAARLSAALCGFFEALPGEPDPADAAALGFAAAGLSPSPLADAAGFAVRLPGGLREIAFVKSAAEASAMRPGPRAAARLAVLLSE